MSCSKTAPWAAQPYPRAPPRARTKPSNCATVTNQSTSAKAFSRRYRPSTPKSARRSTGMEAENQVAIDEAMIQLDGTSNKARLGANAILGVSLAVAKAATEAAGLPLYRYVGGVQARVLPVPMMDIINGGAHPDNPIDFQEFMIMPVGAPSLSEAVRMGAEVFHTLKKALKDAGHNTNVGDEGGFAPNLPSAEAALDFIVQAIETAGFRSGQDVMLALDCAATEFFHDGAYRYAGENQTRDREAQAEYLAKLVTEYPIV